MTNARWIWLLQAALLTSGCTGSSVVVVTVRTDLVYGSEFERVQVAIRGDDTDLVVVEEEGRPQDFATGRQVAQLSVLNGQDLLVEVELQRGDGTLVLARQARVQVDGSTAITLVLTRSCVGVTCDDPNTTCVSAVCVSETCTLGSSEGCGEAECREDSECSPSQGCFEAGCVEGRCLDVESNCAPGESCVDDVCQPVPLAAYSFDEADSGSFPITIFDLAAEPFDLPLSYVDGIPEYRTDADGNHFLYFNSTDAERSVAGANRQTRGTKFARLHLTTTATIELKFRLSDCTDRHQRVFGLASGGTVSDQWFSVREAGMQDILAVHWAGEASWSTYRAVGRACPIEPVVLHWVIDTTRESMTDRVVAYEDGVRQTVEPLEILAPAIWPEMGVGLELDDDELQLTVGRSTLDESRPLGASLWYAAFYLVALNQAQVAARAAALTVNDDSSSAD